MAYPQLTYDLAKELTNEMSDESLFQRVQHDPELKDVILAKIGQYNNSWQPNIRKGFEDWDSYKEMMKWEEGKKETVVHWTRMVLFRFLECWDDPGLREKRKETEDRFEDQKKKREADRLAEIEQKMKLETAMLISSVPAFYEKASLEDFKTDAQKKLISKVLEGGSFLLYGGRGIGKTHFGWAITKEFAKRGKHPYFHKALELKVDLDNILIISRSKNEVVSSIQRITDKYIDGYDVLLVDEVDKAIMGDTAFQYFSYLIDRRYENKKQTIIFCNAENWDDLEKTTGASILSRFKDRSWPARVLNLGADDKRPKEEEIWQGTQSGH